MKREEIMQRLPHRGPMLLVDDILSVQPGEAVLGYKRVRDDEFWAQGHFPGQAVFPGALLIELMAQVSLFLFQAKEDGCTKDPYLARVDQMKFLRPVYPGDELYLSVRPVYTGAGFVKADVCACLDRTLARTAAKGTLTCYVGEDVD